jgi:signal transduction histidine kinase
MMYIDVKDMGKGMSEEEQKRVFDERVRGNSLTEPGYGLGLFLARRAARLQGGDVILVRSSPNEGSVFRILLPYSDYLSDK